MFEHDSVLQTEAVEGLNIQPNGRYVDCTLGAGGHSEEIVKQLSNEGHLFALDQDVDALKAAQDRLSGCSESITFIKANFRNLTAELNKRQVQETNGILFDLGVSSPQFDRGNRGFSYQHDARLDMRMDQTAELDAHTIINTWGYNDLVRIFFKYGEEKFSKQIARRIEREREQYTIESTGQLSEIIKSAIPAPARRKGGHPAKRIFQAVRIAVNDELNAFEEALFQATQLISPGGRVAVITFHSLEDRLCKQMFKTLSSPKDIPRNLPVLPKDHEALFRLITRKPITAADSELEANRRSRSAKLRILEKK